MANYYDNFLPKPPNNTTAINKSSYTGMNAWDNQKDVFFEAPSILADRWNQVFPYRLLVIDVSQNNEVVLKGGDTFISSGYDYFVNGNGFTVTQSLVSNKWQFELPITPQQLSIQDVYAISNTPTLRGIVEEHNGIKYKNITIAGTFGVLTRRNAISSSLGTGTGLFSSIFAGTVAAAQGVANTASKLGNLGGHPAAIDAGQNDPTKLDIQYDTGYYFAMYCGQFIEQYAIAKKDPKNSGWRLVLDMPKRNESYVVTPVTYTSSQSINKPAEYMFQLQLKAWKRIDLNTQPGLQTIGVTKIGLSAFQQINGLLRELRNVIAAATNVLKAVRADFQAIMNMVRQVSLLVRDVAGLVQTAIDLGPSMLKDLKDTVSAFKADLHSFNKINTNSWNNVGTQAQQTLKIIALMSEQTTNREGMSSRQFTQQDSNKSATSPSVEGASGSASTNSANAAATDPITQVFAEPEKSPDFFDSIPVSTLSLTQNQQDAINDEMTLIRLITTADLLKIKNTFQSVALDLASHFGAGDPTVAAIYGRPTPTTRSNPMTIEENDIIQAFFNVISAMDTLTASKQFDTTQQLKQTSLQLVGGLASQANITIPSYNSKYEAPVPYGLSIEQIAMRYLKSPDKWIEIVTLNALREPYIDEVGFSYPLLSNSDGRSFTVNDSSTQLFIGQKITLSDTITLPFVRMIIDVNKISDTSYLVTVDGNADLTLQTNYSAKLKAYLPGTVNSQNTIYIPSNLPSDINSDLFPIPNLSPDKLNDIANVDFLLDESGDIAINSVGDFRLANGLTNLIQAMRLKIQTKKGTLLRHDYYGLGITAGMSTADINSGELIKSLNRMIQNDPRFESISSIQITLQNNILSINMVVNLAQRTGVLPINFDIKI